jgi:uncharacterized protein
MNNNIKRGVWVAALMGCSVLAVSAKGASFDCGKATTKVEKLICSDAELSKLDEKLAETYNNVSKDEQGVELLKREQRTWLKERNRCTNVLCLRDRYQQRIAKLNGASYILLMSKDEKLCNTMLVLYNGDMKTYESIRYDEHEMYTEINWQNDDELELKHAFFDINNDGKNELIIKFVGRLRGYDIDHLLIYSADSNVLSKLKPGAGGLHGLFDTPNQLFSIGNQIYLLKDLPKSPEVAWVGGRFVLNPFLWEGTSYISMTDLTPRWIVIAKYKQSEEMQDICYFFNPNIEHQRY